MLVWRICPESYGSKAFTGSGGLQYRARWHQKGTRIVYASENLSLAALEFFVNLNPDQSALVPMERNFLLNPVHPHFAAIIINQPEAFYFNGRMWKAKRR